MADERIIQVLLHTTLFKGLASEDLKLFSHYFQRLAFEKNDILIREGQLRKALYVLLQGQCQVFLPRTVEGQEGHRITEVPLNTLEAGDCFGEFSLFDSDPASASVIATQPGEVLTLSKPVFDSILKADDRIAKTIYYNLVHVLIQRIKKSEQEYDRIIRVS